MMIRDFDAVVEALASTCRRKRVAVVCPADTHTEYVVKRGLCDGIADFLIVRGGTETLDVEALSRAYPGRVETRDAAGAVEAARLGVALVRSGAADVLMKGTINTDDMLRAILDKSAGLMAPGRVLSHVAVAQVPSYDKLLVFSDAAVIPNPTFEQFEEILGYVVDTCRGLGAERPAVALINFTEKVSEKFPRTLWYEEIKRRATDGAYGDVVVGGPMDVKTACDAESGGIKGIVSPVVGRADALVFPNIEAGNVFYKTITLFAGAETAGMLRGTTRPVVVASRADSCESKYYSLALACLDADRRETAERK